MNRNIFKIFNVVWRFCFGVKPEADATQRLRHSASPAVSRDGLRLVLNVLIIPVMLFVLSQTAMAVAPGTIITNVAHGSYSVGQIDSIQTLSNEVITITTITKTPSSVLLYLYSPGNLSAAAVDISSTEFSLTGNAGDPFNTLPPPVQINGGAIIDLVNPVPMVVTDQYFVGEPIFIELADNDQNIDTTLRESVLVTVRSDLLSEIELLRLVESEPNSGLFTGYIQSGDQISVTPYDGFLTVIEGINIYASYVDAYDSNDQAEGTALIVGASGSLFLTKTAGREVAAVGEYIQYNLTLDNISHLRFPDVSIEDNLPFGVRFESGSVTIDGQPMGDPQISADHRTLTFALGEFVGSSSHTIRYVVSVSPQAKPGVIINTAVAFTPLDERSNIARASVKINDELFTDKAFIAGRVTVKACQEIDTLEIGMGVPGVRLYLEDGTFVVTDSKGFYHFEGVEAGSHVVQLDSASLPENYEFNACVSGRSYAGRNHSQYVDLKQGALWRCDFFLRRKPIPPLPLGILWFELESENTDTTILAQAILNADEVTVNNLKLSLKMPSEADYIVGSSILNGIPLNDPMVTGEIVTYHLDSIQADSQAVLTFMLSVIGQKRSGDILLEGLCTFDTPSDKNLRTEKITNRLDLKYEEERILKPQIVLRPKFASFSADLSESSKKLLDEAAAKFDGEKVVQIYVTGHSDTDRINPRSRHIYPDNYALSLARAESVGLYLGEKLGLYRSQLSMKGRGPDEPVATNATSAGKFLNRRVELEVVVEQIKDIYHITPVDIQDTTAIETIGVHPVKLKEKSKFDVKIISSMPEYNSSRLNTMSTGIDWLWPIKGFYPAIPSIKLAFKHYPNQIIKLTLDNEEVSLLNYVGTALNDSQTVAVSVYNGVDIKEGFNNFAVSIIDTSGQVIKTIEQKVYYSSPAVNATVIDSLSYLLADGRNPVYVAVKMTDINGYPARTGIIGEFTVDPPYMSYKDIESLKNHSPDEQIHKRSVYTVGRDGVTYIKLDPTSRSGEAVIRFKLIDFEKEVRVWLKPEVRDMILVGLAEGTLGYHTVTGNMENLAAAEVDDKFYDNGRLAFYARGRIKGKWLMTMALDTDNNEPDSIGSLFGQINPDKYYTLYGDAATQQYDAPTSGKIYVKMEREGFYTLFGDFNTSLTITELSRYNRNFNGIKTEYYSQRSNLNLFISKSNQLFVKDEIRGDGTSGLYYLTQKNIVINSEEVTIEVRDRFLSEQIISSRTLRRYLDYNIDYFNGSIFFKEAIQSTDENINPVIINIEYETHNPSDEDYTYGGRGAVRFMDNRLETGLSILREGRSAGQGVLGGLDVLYKLTPLTEIKAELAYSDMTLFGQSNYGLAYLTEIKHRQGNFNGKFYFRRQEAGFGFGQQNKTETGTSKIGFDGSYKLNNKWYISSRLYRQSNLNSDTRRDMLEMRMNFTVDQYTAHSGLRLAKDKLPNNMSANSTLLTFGGSYKLYNNKLQFRFEREQGLGTANNSRDFPTRTLLGTEYRPDSRITVFLNQEFTDGEQMNSRDTKMGIKTKPWHGSQLNSYVNRQFTEDGVRVFSNLGLKQTWRLDKKWSIDAGCDLSRTISQDELPAFNENLPPASGNHEDFTAVFAGATYRSKDWSWSTRSEHRFSDHDDKWTFLTGVYGEPKEGLGISFGTQLFLTDSENNYEHSQGRIKLGMVIRPQNSRWTVLNRTDFVFENKIDSLFTNRNRRIINNLNVNLQAAKRWQISWQYRSKYVLDRIDHIHYNGYSDMIGLETRYDLSEKFDFGLHGALLHSWNSRLYDYNSGLSIGYSAFENNWISLGYNFSGFKDQDFSPGNYTVEGPYFKFRLKFDRQSVLSMLKFIGRE